MHFLFFLFFAPPPTSSTKLSILHSKLHYLLAKRSRILSSNPMHVRNVRIASNRELQVIFQKKRCAKPQKTQKTLSYSSPNCFKPNFRPDPITTQQNDLPHKVSAPMVHSALYGILTATSKHAPLFSYFY